MALEAVSEEACLAATAVKVFGEVGSSSSSSHLKSSSDSDVPSVKR